MSNYTNHEQAIKTRKERIDHHGIVGMQGHNAPKCEQCRRKIFDECNDAARPGCGFELYLYQSHSGMFAGQDAYRYGKQKAHGPTRSK